MRMMPGRAPKLKEPSRKEYNEREVNPDIDLLIPYIAYIACLRIFRPVSYKWVTKKNGIRYYKSVRKK